MTHEYLSVMLGVRCTGVTDAMHVLEGQHLIASTRNTIIIKNRAGLIALSDGSYGMAEGEYSRITGIDLATSDVEPVHPSLISWLSRIPTSLRGDVSDVRQAPRLRVNRRDLLAGPRP